MNDSPLIDDILPTYEVNEIHDIWVPLDPATAMAVVRELPAREVRLARPFMAIRGIPSRLRGRATAMATDTPIIEQMFDMGFAPLAASGTSEAHELVFGAIGKFWKLSGNLPVPGIDGRSEFDSFDEADHAKAVINFQIVREGDGSRITTETRVMTTSNAARRKFKLYWAFIGLGSALIRRSWLKGIKRVAKRRPQPVAA